MPASTLGPGNRPSRRWARRAWKVAVLSIPLVLWFGNFIDVGVMVDNRAATLWVHAPTTGRPGETLAFTVEAWDGYERLAGGYRGTVRFFIEAYQLESGNPLELPASFNPGAYTFTSNFRGAGVVPAYKVSGADNGKAHFQVTIPDPGIYYLRVTEEATGSTFRSNPIVVNTTHEREIAWGDIHGHTLYSDGSGLPGEAYAFARDVALLDFAALTDHLEHVPRVGDLDLVNQFQRYVAITNQYDTPGQFVTLVAVEWTPKYIVHGTVTSGHINAYFKGASAPYFSTFSHRSPEEIYAFLETHAGSEYVAWSHHTLRSGMITDLAYYHPGVNTLVEVYSAHGSSETATADALYPIVDEVPVNGSSVRDALRMGRRFGLEASSDTHDGRLGHSISHTPAVALNQYPYSLSGYRVANAHPGGLTGAYVSNLTREAVFEALQARATCASTWVTRPYLRLTVNGVMVGEANSTARVPTATTPRVVEVQACVDGVSIAPNQVVTVDRVEIFKNSEPWQVIWGNNQSIVGASVVDASPVTGTAYEACVQRADGHWYVNEYSDRPVVPETLTTAGADYYYARVRDTNNQTAWMGPIWVEVSP